MSDAQKPVEETPAAAPATETPADVPATETPAAEAPKDIPAETTEAAPAAESAEAAEDAAKEEPAKEEVKKEITPATDGVLGHKGPGLVKSLRFAKRYFYFSEEPVEVKSLSHYLQSEKAAIAHPVAAWASQSGKGLLFFAKRIEDKATPAGIFSLADVSDITKESHSEFHFKVHGQKHTFQASSVDERDSWVVALEAKVAEAKAEKDIITASEGYKAELEKLNKRAEPEKKDELAPEEPANAKSRSQSRKRASIFGAFLGKKEEAEEKPEEAKPAEATAAGEPIEATGAAEAPAETPAAEATEDKKEEKEEKKPEVPPKNKRTSIFGNFFQKVTSPTVEKSEKEATATQETTAVSSTAPQLENPVEEAAKPAEGEAEAAPAEAEAEAAKETATSPATETPAEASTPKDKRRTSFFGLGIKKEKKGETSDSEGEKGKNKLGGLFRKPSKAVKSGKDKEAAPEAIPEDEDKPEPISKDAPAEENPAEEAAKEESADAPAAANVANASAPIQAAA